jgi:class 3 adenylate cyclase/tetratricopeptide (TPR) repeat protein
MQCPKCQFENPEGIKFCGQCGAKLEKICLSCNSPNPPPFKYCGECGSKLDSAADKPSKDLPIDEKIEKIQKYLPEGLTEKILSQKDRIEGERKHVTVMFCDMVGFTQLAEKLGIEESYTIMDQVYELLIHKVHDYEGTVNEMTGDGIMALFGAPIAVEDAPLRAIRSAYSIHREISRFSDRLRQERDNISPLKMRIGIHTGPVVVGTVGNDLRVEFKAVGDTVNLASRMEGLAEPGTTYVTAEIFNLAEGFFRFESLGEKDIKGKTAPIKTYRVIAPSTRRTRFDVSAERGLTTFIGRERELELLLDGFKRAKDGRGQAFSIMAEAGIGKSRLLYEFRKAVINEDITFLEGKCLSYSRGVAYHPVIDVLKSNFDIQEEDTDLEITKKVKEGSNRIGADETSTLPYILELLSVKGSGIDTIPMSPEARKDRIIAAVKQITLRGSEIRPLIIAIEDLHWIDKGSEECLKDLLDHISGAKIFLIFTFRPEFVHTWGARSFHNQVNLNRLSNRESLIMVSHYLGTKELDKNLEDFILLKTEGIPFFTEEFIKSLKDMKIIEGEVNRYRIATDIQEAVIPSTIQDVIMARVDSLPEEIKSFLQTASVVGREFSHDLISRVTSLAKQELVSHLSALKDSELLYERGLFPQSTYIFKHALTQEVVYESLLSKRRKKIHEKISVALEALYSKRLDEYYELLAFHSLQGEDWQRAYKYSREVGLKTFSLSAYEEAQNHFVAALEALHKLPQTTDRIEKEIDLIFNMRAALFPQARHQEWGKWMRDAESLAQQINDDARLSNVFNYLSNFHWIHGECMKAIELGEKGLELSQKAGDFTCQVGTLFHLGFYFHTIGNFSRQLQLHKKLIELLDKETSFRRYGMANVPAATTRSCLVLGMAELGNFQEIDKIGQKAVKIAEEAKNAFTLVVVYNLIALAYLRQGKLSPAFQLLEKSYKQCRQSGVRTHFSYTMGNLGYAYLLSNEPGRALTILEEGAEKENLDPASFWVAHPLIVLAEAYRVTGKLKLANETISRALKLASTREERVLEAWAMPVIAEINADMDRIDQAIDWYRRGLTRASDFSMLPLTARCHLGLGQLLIKIGDMAEARAAINAAIDLYRSMDISLWEQQAEDALAKIDRMTSQF